MAPSVRLFGFCQKLFASSVRSICHRFTAFFGSSYHSEETFSQTKIINSRYQSRLTDEHWNQCLNLCLSNYESSFSELSQDMQCVHSLAVGELVKTTVFLWQTVSVLDYQFLGAFAKLRKITISYFMSVRPHGTTRLPLEGFLWNFMFDYFSKMYREYLSLIRIGQK